MTKLLVDLDAPRQSLIDHLSICSVDPLSKVAIRNDLKQVKTTPTISKTAYGTGIPMTLQSNQSQTDSKKAAIF